MANIVVCQPMSIVRNREKIMDKPKDPLAELSGKVVLECSRCHHETREPEEYENHAFDCEFDGRKNTCKVEKSITV